MVNSRRGTVRTAILAAVDDGINAGERAGRFGERHQDRGDE